MCEDPNLLNWLPDLTKVDGNEIVDALRKYRIRRAAIEPFSVIRFST
jgi:hypothetical protein